MNIIERLQHLKDVDIPNSSAIYPESPTYILPTAVAPFATDRITSEEFPQAQKDLEFILALGDAATSF